MSSLFQGMCLFVQIFKERERKWNEDLQLHLKGEREGKGTWVMDGCVVMACQEIERNRKGRRK